MKYDNIVPYLLLKKVVAHKNMFGLSLVIEIRFEHKRNNSLIVFVEKNWLLWMANFRK